jgi:heme/copper-type cytochrome/quinol oxidase subunit 3
MTTGTRQDVSHLPTYGFGPKSLVWWGNLGFIAIESTVFVLAIATYFYLRSQNGDWPLNVPPPELTAATVASVTVILSEVPNQWVKRKAKQHDLRAVRRGLLLMTVVGLVLLGLRTWQFLELNCRWDTNAYGSIVWALMFLHTVHIVSDFGETVVIAAIMTFGPVDGRRFSDVVENQDYWDFVVISWLVLYVVIYLVPRWLGGTG